MLTFEFDRSPEVPAGKLAVPVIEPVVGAGVVSLFFLHPEKTTATLKKMIPLITSVLIFFMVF